MKRKREKKGEMQVLCRKKRNENKILIIAIMMK